MLPDTKANRGVTKGREGGLTLCQIEGTHQIVMSTSMPCFTYVTKRFLKSRGGGSWAPQDPPSQRVPHDFIVYNV